MTVDGLADMWADYVIAKLPHNPASKRCFDLNHTTSSPITIHPNSLTTRDLQILHRTNFSQNGIPYPNLNFSHRICRHLSSFRHCLAPHQAGQLPQLLDRFGQG
jgi:hypothetical protein